MKTIIYLQIIPLLLLITSCASKSTEFDKQYNYLEVIKQHTQKEKKYSGFSNLYEVSVTHMTDKVLSLKNQKQAFLQQWPSHKMEEASQKQEEKLAKETQFVVFLYTPIAKNNDLNKGENSIWRTYIQVGDERFPGIISKSKYKLTQNASLFPGVNRFTKPYEISFPVANDESSRGPIKFIITSSLGTSEFTFNQ